MADARESVDADVIQKLTVADLKNELKFRRLPENGNKHELVLRLQEDNERLCADETMHILSEARQKQTAEEVQKQKTDILLTQMQNQIDDLSRQLKESRKSNTSTPSAAATPVSENTLMIQILQQLSATQVTLMKQMCENQAPTLNVVSTNDTASAISTFEGRPVDNPKEWIKEVERIATHAHWTSSLMLVNAVTRLKGSASNWHKVSGKRYDSWEEWKKQLCERFKSSMSFAEFIVFQAKRQLRSNESIVDYIYDKDALFEKAPMTIPQNDRVSLIIEGIQDDRWSVPLASLNCHEVYTLIDHATPLDKIRQLKETSSVESCYRLTGKQEKPTSESSAATKSAFIPRYNPDNDKEEDQTCYRCKTKGHVSYNCPFTKNDKSSTDNTMSWGNKPKMQKPADQVSTERSPVVQSTAKARPDSQVNCVQSVNAGVTLIPVILNGDTAIEALVDSGSVITLVRQDIVPKSTHVYPWQKGRYKVAENVITPVGWFTSRLQLGRIDYVMPQIGICKSLPVPMILGRDWQIAVNARFIFEPDGSVCIMTPTTTEKFSCVSADLTTVGCVVPISMEWQNIDAKLSNEVSSPINQTSPDFTKENLAAGFSEVERVESNKRPEVLITSQQQEELDQLINEFQDIHKTAVVTPDYHVEILRVMFELSDGLAIMSTVIKANYGHLFSQGVCTYFDDVPGGAYSVDVLLKLLRNVFEVTSSKNLRLKKDKCIFMARNLVQHKSTCFLPFYFVHGYYPRVPPKPNFDVQSEVPVEVSHMQMS